MTWKEAPDCIRLLININKMARRDDRINNKAMKFTRIHNRFNLLLPMKIVGIIKHFNYRGRKILGERRELELGVAIVDHELALDTIIEFGEDDGKNNYTR